MGDQAGDTGQLCSDFRCRHSSVCLTGAVPETPDVTLDIAGNGPDLDRLKKLSSPPLHLYTAKNNNPRITFHGYLGEAELKKLLESCDVGLVPMFPESCVGVPGKLADYAAAGLRVIESLGGECQAIVEKYGAGVHYQAGSVESLKKAITDLSSTSTQNFNSPGFAQEFNATVVMDEYVKWAQGLCECQKQWGNTRGPHGGQRCAK